MCWQKKKEKEKERKEKKKTWSDCKIFSGNEER